MLAPIGKVVWSFSNTNIFKGGKRKMKPTSLILQKHGTTDSLESND